MKGMILLLLLPLAAPAEDRITEAVLTLAIREVPNGAAVIRVRVPLPRTDENQVLADYLVRGGHRAAVDSDPATGNQALSVALTGSAVRAETTLQVRFRIDLPSSFRARPASVEGHPYLARLMPPERQPLPVPGGGADRRNAVRQAVLRAGGPYRGPGGNRFLHARLVEELRGEGIGARLVAGLVLPEDARVWTADGPRYWVDYDLDEGGWESLDLAADVAEGPFDNRIVLAVDAEAGTAGAAGIEKPLVEIDGMPHTDFETEWSGRDVRRDPVTLVFHPPARGR